MLQCGLRWHWQCGLHRMIQMDLGWSRMVMWQ